MKVLLVMLSLVIGTSSLATAATCGDLDESVAIAREAMWKASTSKSKVTKLSQVEIAQILSTLISYKLENSKLEVDKRVELQQEHEGVCSVL